MSAQILKKSDFDQLIKALQNAGYDVYGPQVKDGAIVFDLLESASQLPQNYSDEQQPGHYHLIKTQNHQQNSRWFSWANTAQGIKPFVFSPTETLWSVKKMRSGEISFDDTQISEKPKAIIGVRNCDLAALDLQDQHFLKQTHVDPYYKTRRQNLLLVAVNCTHPAQTCFCQSTGDGPIVQSRFDLVLDELDAGFVIKAGSNMGEKLLNTLPLTMASHFQQTQLRKQHDEVKNIKMPSLPAINIKHALKKSFDNHYWETVAQHCLACGNCTSVCPTCFCYSEQDKTELDGSSSTHIRQWDSCFNSSHSYIHGIVVRSETKFRYRQWLTHKFSGWFDQYGRSGCVGCGRCTTWCPVGIDVINSIKNVCEVSDE